ncbi:MinD superfamily P-loop ATPase containing an inserted ferredoxin domain [Desulfurella amilsii]|uniref:MinD superfamily P-loop ATPase containing an inserted ferredoxin domain n=1 Tax=Desulfurella amilsii TaxID=1562698 RepID=A0A1X4XYN9_9BACT|nr:ATP-binding protein [Desulfurella amilsii]OSS42661.1 MinD superfamily P-loop ATPase containing an inserted ferredoxin domain [Desulfurella amilsii]
MIIAVLSGKGGTGKTTVSTNLAYVLGKNGFKVKLIDLDAEEPNAHLFFDVNFSKKNNVDVYIPKVDNCICTHCGDCAKACQFSAIVVSRQSVIVFAHLCHACGACLLACKYGAIQEIPKNIGVISIGKAQANIDFVKSEMNIGEPSAVRIIRQAKKYTEKDKINILDCPPGVSCPTVESIQMVDFCVLVTEPTPFGLHDLKLAVDLTKQFGLKIGVVINRYDANFLELELYLEENHIPILLKIPYDRNIAQSYSKGELFSKTIVEYKNAFLELYNKILEISE